VETDVENAPGEHRLSSVQVEEIRHWLREGLAQSKASLGEGYQAAVYRYRGPSGEYVIKKAHDSPFRRSFGEAAIRREERIYRRLGGIPGIPHCMGLIDGRYLVLEYVPGDSFRKLQQDLGNRELFFQRLLTTLRGMHAAGVAHGDLKRKDNILVGPNQTPFVIDFGVACVRKADGNAWNRFLFKSVMQADYNAWIKHKYRGKPEPLSAEDRRLYRPMLLETLARAIRITWQKITFRRLRKRSKKTAND